MIVKKYVDTPPLVFDGATTDLTLLFFPAAADIPQTMCALPGEPLPVQSYSAPPPQPPRRGQFDSRSWRRRRSAWQVYAVKWRTGGAFRYSSQQLKLVLRSTAPAIKRQMRIGTFSEMRGRFAVWGIRYCDIEMVHTSQPNPISKLSVWFENNLTRLVCFRLVYRCSPKVF